ncbi:hypothetical protein BSZ19_44590 [Bradyrhizobium japonicum]|uniref:Uncharacterized protein n=1 Tax=Bradyrhizobium japonicum TaxID=375 RepID=A0A1Y2J9V3_BRAJP|nr:hypothetical protein BSZ19_44590 [Bradyrhizobium japonicum]
MVGVSTISLSCPAKAGHPVRRGLSAPAAPPRRTGSPGQAGRRQRRVGESAPNFPFHQGPFYCAWGCFHRFRLEPRRDPNSLKLRAIPQGSIEHAS